MSDANLVVDLSLVSSGFHKGIADARQALENFGHSAESMLGKIAAAGGVFLVFEAISKGFSGAIADITKLSQAFNSLGGTGEGFRQFQGLTQAASKFGLTTDQVTNSVSTLQKKISGTDVKDLKAFYNIGINPADLAKMDPTTQLVTVANGLRNIKDESERTKLGVQLLGESFRTSSKFLNSDITGAISQLDKLGTTLSAQQADAVQKMSEAKNTLSTVFSSFGEHVMADLAPTFTRLFSYITETINKMGGIEPVAKRFADALIEGVNRTEQALGKLVQHYQELKNVLGQTNEPSVLANPVSEFIGEQATGFKNKFNNNVDLYAYQKKNYSQIPNMATGSKKETQLDSVIAPFTIAVPRFTKSTETAAAAMEAFSEAAKRTTDAFTKALKPNSHALIKKIVEGSGQKVDEQDNEEFNTTAGELLHSLQEGQSLFSGTNGSKFARLKEIAKGGDDEQISINHALNTLQAQDPDAFNKALLNGQYDKELNDPGKSHASELSVIKELESFAEKHGTSAATIADNGNQTTTASGTHDPSLKNYHSDTDKQKYMQDLAAMLGDKNSKNKTTEQLNDYLQNQGKAGNDNKSIKVVVEPSPLFKVTVMQYGQEAAKTLAENEARGVSN